MGFVAGDTNLRRYVGNSPANFTDPTGLEEQPNLLQLTERDPQLKTLAKDQRQQLIQDLQDTKGKVFRFATTGGQLFGTLERENYRKDWWFIGPGDFNYPGNVNGDYAVTYNCLGHVLMWYGQSTFNGKNIASNGTATWPRSADENTVALTEIDKSLKEFDKIFAELGKPGFTRLKWKPDFSSPAAAGKTPLPEFNKNYNYIVLMANLLSGGNLDKPVTGVRPSHVFTNTDDNPDLWVSKTGNGGTMFFKDPNALVGDDELNLGLGFIVAIWERKCNE